MGYLNNTNDRPVIGITIGDFNGIGPEVILKTLSDNRILKYCIPVIYGSTKLFSKYKKLVTAEDFSFFQIKAAEAINPKKINLINCWEDDYEINPGKVTPEAGKCAFLSLNRAAEDVIAGKLDAIVTAPINKKNIQTEEFKFPGHTEYLTEKCGVNESVMLMVSDNLRIGIATGHIPLAEVRKNLSKEKLLTKLNVLYKSLKNDFGIIKPKVAILGVNPHAGEDGMMGSEEKELLIPMIEELKQKGILLFGPYPADGFFGVKHFKKFDAVLAMYHDQGLIPFKTMAFENGVNFTAGLPIIRTSPDHGTAYDLAGKDLADPGSFREALYLACDIVKIRKPMVSA